MQSCYWRRLEEAAGGKASPCRVVDAEETLSLSFWVFYRLALTMALIMAREAHSPIKPHTDRETPLFHHPRFYYRWIYTGRQRKLAVLAYNNRVHPGPLSSPLINDTGNKKHAFKINISRFLSWRLSCVANMSSIEKCVDQTPFLSFREQYTHDLIIINKLVLQFMCKKKDKYIVIKKEFLLPIGTTVG